MPHIKVNIKSFASGPDEGLKTHNLAGTLVKIKTLLLKQYICYS